MHHAKNKVFLHPGEFLFTNGETHIHTLLGSCVAITLWHPHLHVGGMCHFVLPSRSAAHNVLDAEGRYAEGAMELFRRSVTQHGTTLKEYQGKIFGGANVLGKEAGNKQDLIGMRNAEVAMQLLMQNDIKVAVAHVGEFGHRRIVFDVSNGDVWVRHHLTDGGRLGAISGVS